MPVEFWLWLLAVIVLVLGGVWYVVSVESELIERIETERKSSHDFTPKD